MKNTKLSLAVVNYRWLQLQSMKPGYVVRIWVRYDTGTRIREIFKIRIRYG